MYRISHTCIQFHTALHQLISFHSWGHKLQDSNRQGWDGAGKNVQLGVWQIKMKKMNANEAALMGDDEIDGRWWEHVKVPAQNRILNFISLDSLRGLRLFEMVLSWFPYMLVPPMFFFCAVPMQTKDAKN